MSKEDVVPNKNGMEEHSVMRMDKAAQGSTLQLLTRDSN